MKIVQLVKATHKEDSHAAKNPGKRFNATHCFLPDDRVGIRSGRDSRNSGAVGNSRFKPSHRRVKGIRESRLLSQQTKSDQFTSIEVPNYFWKAASAVFLCFAIANCDGSWNSYNTYDEIRGKVVRVADGDTITVREPNSDQTKIRLFGIDAPERGQAFGQKSRKTLANLVANQTVDILIEDEDQYGRIVGIVLLNDKNINLSMVESGMAWVYRRYQDNPEWIEAEENARDARRGLWIDSNPERPAEWRYRNRN